VTPWGITEEVTGESQGSPGIIGDHADVLVQIALRDTGAAGRLGPGVRNRLHHTRRPYGAVMAIIAHHPAHPFGFGQRFAADAPAVAKPAIKPPTGSGGGKRGTARRSNRPARIAPSDNSGSKLHFCAINEELLLRGSVLRLVNSGDDLDRGEPVISGGQ
jgi:hypothetical protein